MVAPPMQFSRFLRRALLSGLACASLPILIAQEAELPPIPADLIDDDHVREEFGINEFTTPSIRRLFEDLDSLGTLPYDDLVRTIPGRVSPDRALVAISTGVLIADGFLAIHSEKIDAIEGIGKAILENAKSLGAKDRVSQHASSLLEGSIEGDWETLKSELAATQADVEAEMLLLRDSEVAHLVSLGGWIRAFHIATHSAKSSFTPERAAILARSDIAGYYAAGLENLRPALLKRAYAQDLLAKVSALRDELRPLEDKPLTEADLEVLSKRSAELLAIVTGALEQ